MPQPPMRLVPVTNGSIMKCQLSARRRIFTTFTEARMAMQDSITVSCIALANPDFHLHFQIKGHGKVI